MKQMQLADRFTCVSELKWPPIYMTDLPMGTTSLHQTSASSPHIGYYHQLAQVCHPLNTFSGELVLDHWHNSCCHAAYTSLSTVPVNYTVVVLTPHLWLCRTHCGIHFLDLPVHTLAHFLHELSLLPTGSSWLPGLTLGHVPKETINQTVHLQQMSHLLQWSHLTSHNKNEPSSFLTNGPPISLVRQQNCWA